jgi:hypothetical protein
VCEELEGDAVPHKATKRAERRHHHERLFKKYDTLLNVYHYWGGDFDKEHIRKLQDNFSVCSCSMCRNERRNPWTSGEERLTMQERKMWKVEDFDLDVDFDPEMNDTNGKEIQS